MVMIGKMRHRITFKAPAAVPVGAGGSVATYTDVLTDWAKARQANSDTGVEAMATAMRRQFKFTLRWRTGFEPRYDMIIAYDGKLFSITGIDDVAERDRFWIVTAVEKS
jgi:SPP1 family predicted phage head-tail adaptor